MAGRIAATGLGGIDASNSSQFRLAAMRCGDASATLTSVTVRCLIVDDNPSFLEAARTLLEREGLVVAGLASTSAAALQVVETLRPDVVLVDVSLGEESGFELARRLAVEQDHGAAVILISTRSEADLADLVAASPADGFLSKSELSADAIRGFVDGA